MVKTLKRVADTQTHKIMYTLRIIEETRENKNEPFQQVITDYELGESYSIIKNGISKEFDEIMDKQYPNYEKTDIRGIVVGENEKIFFLMKDSNTINNTYYTMSDGKTLTRW